LASPWLLEQQWRKDCGCFEGDALHWGPFAIGCEEATERLREVLATLTTWKLEHVLAPARDSFVGSLNILDEVGAIASAPFENWGWYRVERRELSDFAA
jgi:hypothetical protein